MAGQVLAVHRRATNGVDELVSCRVLPKLDLQQIDVAENHRKDVVEVVGDATRELTDRFHFLCAKQRFSRLLERLVCLLELGDIVRDAVEAQNVSVAIAIDAFGDEVGLRCPSVSYRQAFKGLRHPRGEQRVERRQPENEKCQVAGGKRQPRRECGPPAS